MPWSFKTFAVNFSYHIGFVVRTIDLLYYLILKKMETRPIAFLCPLTGSKCSNYNCIMKPSSEDPIVCMRNSVLSTYDFVSTLILLSQCVRHHKTRYSQLRIQFPFGLHCHVWLQIITRAAIYNLRSCFVSMWDAAMRNRLYHSRKRWRAGFDT